MALRGLAYTVGISGFGYVLMKIVTPDEKEILKKIPESQQGYRVDSLKRKEAIVNVLKNAAEGREPMYRQTKQEIEDKIVNKK